MTYTPPFCDFTAAFSKNYQFSLISVQIPCATKKAESLPSASNSFSSSPKQENVVHDHRIIESQIRNPRKHQRSEQPLPQLNKSSQSLLKRKMQRHPHRGERDRTPPEFYDNLSKLWLTKGTLREFDRRNDLSASSPPSSLQSIHKSFNPHTPVQPKQKTLLTPSPSEFLNHCPSNCLEDLKQIARHGGPDLSDLRDYLHSMNPPNHAPRSRGRGRGQSRGRDQTQGTPDDGATPIPSSKKTGPYNRAFEQNLEDHGIYPLNYDYPEDEGPPLPKNWDEINERLARRRPSLSPSRFPDSAFKRFRQANAAVKKENQLIESVISTIEGGIENRLCVSGGVPFTNLDPLTDGSITSGSPDRYYGARPKKLNRLIRNQLRGTIVPSTQEDLPMAPNFFLEAKGPDGSDSVARIQATYDGALGARGIQSLQSYGKSEPLYDDNAYTITSTYHGSTLIMYSSHPTKPIGHSNHPEYHINQLDGWCLTGNLKTFREGATAYRNARDWTKEKRDEFIEAANERMPDVGTESQENLDTSFDELA